jgi:hypothetical protein
MSKQHSAKFIVARLELCSLFKIFLMCNIIVD